MSLKNYLLFFALGFSSIFMSQEMYAMNAAFPMLISSDSPQEIYSENVAKAPEEKSSSSCGKILKAYIS